MHPSICSVEMNPTNYILQTCIGVIITPLHHVVIA